MDDGTKQFLMLALRAMVVLAIGLCAARGLLLTASHVIANGASQGGRVVLLSLVAGVVFLAQAFVVAGIRAQALQIARLTSFREGDTGADPAGRAGRLILWLLVLGFGVAVVLAWFAQAVLPRI